MCATISATCLWNNGNGCRCADRNVVIAMTQKTVSTACPRSLSSPSVASKELNLKSNHRTYITDIRHSYCVFFFFQMMMLPREIFTDHVKPFLGPEVLFEFVRAWEDEDDMIVVLRWFFQQGLMDPYYVSAFKWNLLSWACFHNHRETIDLLLEMKIDLHRLTGTFVYIYKSSPTLDFHMNAIDIVCYYNRMDILKKIVAYDPSVLTSANIHYACEMDHTEMCEFLVCHCRNLVLDPQLYWSVCRHNNIRLFRLLKEKGCPLTHRSVSGRTLLMYACMQECLEIVRDLLVCGGVPDINEQDDHGNTALMCICKPLSMSHHAKNRRSDEHIKLQIVKLLVDYGIHVNLQKKCGVSALFIAFQHHYYSITAYLLKKGADINIQDYSGWDCLMYACQSGNQEAARWIVGHGIHLWHKNKEGMNALMFACRYKRHNIFDLILGRCGGDPHYLDTQDNMGHTALMWACVNTPDPCMVRKLVKKGADVSLKTIHGTTALHLAYEYGSDDNTLAMLMP